MAVYTVCPRLVECIAVSNGLVEVTTQGSRDKDETSKNKQLWPPRTIVDNCQKK